jgi:flagellar basal-body rod modification protein FlgD
MSTTDLFATQASTSASSTTSDDSTSIAGNGSPSDLFTQLLVAQIKNQDPLSPTDPSQFVAQLAQLSQVESLNKLTTQSTAQGAALLSLQATVLGAQVGSNVSVTSDHVQLATNPVTGRFTLASASAKTTLILTGTDGAAHAIDLGSLPVGEVGLKLDASQLGLPAGNYAMSVQATGQDAPPISVDGTLTGVHLAASGSALLDISSAGEVPASALTGFNGRAAVTP